MRAMQHRTRHHARLIECPLVVLCMHKGDARRPIPRTAVQAVASNANLRHTYTFVRVLQGKRPMRHGSSSCRSDGQPFSAQGPTGCDAVVSDGRESEAVARLSIGMALHITLDRGCFLYLLTNIMCLAFCFA
jgi:hypothetical protein